MKRLNFVILVVLLASCSKSTDVLVDCEEKILSVYDMKKFENQDFGCKNFLEVYDWEGSNCFVVNNQCALVNSDITDCEGNSLCGFGCPTFRRDAKLLGIIGISE